MNSIAYSWWGFINCCMVLLIFWAGFKVLKTSFRFSFLYLMLATVLYLNLLFTKWFTHFGSESPLLLTKWIFTSGILIHSAFGFFIVTLIENAPLLKKKYFWAAQALLLVVALLAASTDFIISEVALQNVYPRFVATHGVGHKPMLVILASFAIAMLWYLQYSQRKSTNPLEKYQLRTVLVSSGIVFLGMTFTNGILPALTKQSYLSVLGGVFPVIFFASVMQLIVNGDSILLKRQFASLLRHESARNAENQAAIREVIEGLRSILHKGASQLMRKFNVRHSPESVTAFVLASDAPAALSPVPSEILLKNLTNFNRQLTAENHRLLFSLVRAESMMHEKWIESEVNRSLTAPQRQISQGQQTYAELDNSLQEFGTFWGKDIICGAPESLRLFQKILKKKDLSHPLIMTGEPSTGKATLCRGLHHVRKAGRLTEFSCSLSSLDDIKAKITQELNQKVQQTPGILIRHADELGNKGIRTLMQIIETCSGKIFFYLTGSENFTQYNSEKQLLQRISGNTLVSIPLRNRPEDTRLFALYFAREFSNSIKVAPPNFNAQTLNGLAAYKWPGNIQELKEFIEKNIAENPKSALAALPLPLLPQSTSKTLSPLESVERSVITEYLLKNRYNKNRTRIELGITINTLNAKIAKYGIKLPKERAPR